jgi:salicylate 5-hydroxylase small subunit
MSRRPGFDAQGRAELLLDLTELNHDYAAALDNEEFDRWPDFFTEDCLYRIVPRENHLRGLPIALMHCESRGMLRDRAYAVQHTVMAQSRTLRHFISNIRILGTDADDAVAEANFLVVRTMPERLTEILIAGRYLDRIVRPNDRLLFKERLCVYDSLLIPTSIIEPI